MAPRTSRLSGSRTQRSAGKPGASDPKRLSRPSTFAGLAVAAARAAPAFPSAPSACAGASPISWRIASSRRALRVNQTSPPPSRSSSTNAGPTPPITANTSAKKTRANRQRAEEVLATGISPSSPAGLAEPTKILPNGTTNRNALSCIPAARLSARVNTR